VYRNTGSVQWGVVVLGWAVILGLLCGFDLPSAPQPTLPFQEGEALTFEVRWLGVPVGTAVMSVGKPIRMHGHDILPLVSLAHSAPFFATFYFDCLYGLT